MNKPDKVQSNGAVGISRQPMCISKKGGVLNMAHNHVGHFLRAVPWAFR